LTAHAVFGAHAGIDCACDAEKNKVIAASNSSDNNHRWLRASVGFMNILDWGADAALRRGA
jgi:hypothetical protein